MYGSEVEADEPVGDPGEADGLRQGSADADAVENELDSEDRWPTFWPPIDGPRVNAKANGLAVSCAEIAHLLGRSLPAHRVLQPPPSDERSDWLRDSAMVRRDGAAQVLPSCEGLLGVEPLQTTACRARSSGTSSRRRKDKATKTGGLAKHWRTGARTRARGGAAVTRTSLDIATGVESLRRNGGAVEADAHSAVGAPTVVARTATEYGNAVWGLDAQGMPYCIVGEDSVSLTRALLARDPGEVLEPSIAEALAQDLGVPADRIIVIPQVEYHIDLGVMPWGPGRVMLNDAQAVLEIQRHQIFDIERLTASAVEETRLESLNEHEVSVLRALAEARDAFDLQSQMPPSGWCNRSFEHWVKQQLKTLEALKTHAEARIVQELAALECLEAHGLEVHRVPSYFPAVLSTGRIMPAAAMLNGVAEGDRWLTGAPLGPEEMPAAVKTAFWDRQVYEQAFREAIGRDGADRPVELDVLKGDPARIFAQHGAGLRCATRAVPAVDGEWPRGYEPWPRPKEM